MFLVYLISVYVFAAFAVFVWLLMVYDSNRTSGVKDDHPSGDGKQTRIEDTSCLTSEEGRMVSDAIKKRGYDCTFDIAVGPWRTGILFIVQRDPDFITLTVNSFGKTIEDQIEHAICYFEAAKDIIIREFYENKAAIKNKNIVRENIIKLLEPCFMD